ncbi:Flp pilus assembly pilin Flp [Kineococcus radiotolerans]|uniref:Flp/Fap pilin component n=2 Tax=Kineococcus radiotolerans TaxID=131568 RepID=A6WCQ6_KINRD|nr:hypothetical protein [Kineococcus radiotolerans]ABS04595.1 hypothetical protein Krad_3131 [Kineococcus radiotolerans SRS30216 = ATCC BAA-149]MBB2902731.1 Flp pilus assembly pilin Flp [Kineococcus radiotolerans]
MSDHFLLISRLARLLSARARRAAASGRDAGASALEWAVIAAIVVVAATLIGGAVYNIVQSKSEGLTECAAVAVGSNC